jgi:hypothetical protein
MNLIADFGARPNFLSRNLKIELVMFGVVLFWLFGQSSLVAAEPRVERSAMLGSETELALVGYNYTLRYIHSFSVDDKGGGNIHVSGPTSGGGGIVCCLSYTRGASAGQVMVRWQSGGCTYRAPGPLSDGRTHLVHNFYHEIKVQIDPSIPDRPRYFEVHFFSDGRVEAAITDKISPPRIALSESRADRSQFQRCPGDQKPNK